MAMLWEHAFTSFQFIVFIQNSRCTGQANRSPIHGQGAPGSGVPHLLLPHLSFQSSVEAVSHRRPPRKTEGRADSLPSWWGWEASP